MTTEGEIDYVKAKEEVLVSEQVIENKYPDDDLPTDGEIWGIARFENGRIKPLEGKGDTFTPDFVINLKGELILGKKHHFLGNRSSVLAAGTLKVVGGKIKRISNDSGHYLPTLDQAENFPDLFKKLGADLTNTALNIIYVDNAGKLDDLTKFLK